MTAWRDHPVRALDIRPGMWLRPEPARPPVRVTHVVIFAGRVTVHFDTPDLFFVDYPHDLTVRAHVPLDVIDRDVTDCAIVTANLETAR